MTKNDIIRMARGAGAVFPSVGIWHRFDSPEELAEFANLVAAHKAEIITAEPPPEWLLIKNILDEYGLQAIDFVAEFKAAQQVATIWKQAKPFSPGAINTTQTAWRMGYEAAKAEQQAEMRLPKVGDRVICLEDESLGTIVSLTAGGSPDITFDDGTRGTYLLREFAELFGYVAPPKRQWVGLTDEDVRQCSRDVVAGGSENSVDRFAYAIEAKLKERNT